MRLPPAVPRQDNEIRIKASLGPAGVVEAAEEAREIPSKTNPILAGYQAEWDIKTCIRNAFLSAEIDPDVLGEFIIDRHHRPMSRAREYDNRS